MEELTEAIAAKERKGRKEEFRRFKFNIHFPAPPGGD
jgi:hypothetical protein